MSCFSWFNWLANSLYIYIVLYRKQWSEFGACESYYTKNNVYLFNRANFDWCFKNVWFLFSCHTYVDLSRIINAYLKCTQGYVSMYDLEIV